MTSIMTFFPIPKHFYSFFSNDCEDIVNKLESVDLFDSVLNSLTQIMFKLFAFSHPSSPPYFNFNGKGSAIILQKELRISKKNGFSIILDFRLRKVQKTNFSNILKNQFSDENFSIEIKHTLILKDDYCKNKIAEKKGILEEEKHKNRADLINIMNIKKGVMQIFLEEKNGQENGYGCLKTVLTLEKKYHEVCYNFNFDDEKWYFLVFNYSYQDSKVKSHLNIKIKMIS